VHRTIRLIRCTSSARGQRLPEICDRLNEIEEQLANMVPNHNSGYWYSAVSGRR